MNLARPPSPTPRGPRRLRVVACSLALVVLAAACSSSDDEADDTSGDTGGSASTTAPAEELLGTPNPAEGEPVKVGFVSDGQTAAFDWSVQIDAAEAITEYLNDYRGGIAGRPVELVTCETGGEQGKATDCANELVQAGVVVTVMPESSSPLAVFNVMSEENLPLFVYGVGDQAMLFDTESTFALVDAVPGLSALPIDVAKQNGIDKVSAVVIDVPSATAYFETIGAAAFEEAGIELDLIPVPPGTADLTPQMTEIANGDPTVVHMIGDEGLCIAILNGLAAAGYDGPIDTLNNCLTDAVKTAVGDYLEGVVVATPIAFGDPDESDLALMEAIYEHYDADIEDTKKGGITFATIMGMREALEGLTGEVTPASLIAAIKAMPATDLPAGGGLQFRCNGQAQPLTPAVCTSGALRSSLDAGGEPILPYEPVGSHPIPDAP